MSPEESLWPSRADTGRGLTSGTFYAQLRRHLKQAGLQPAEVHILRHTAAKLRRLEGQEDLGWGRVAEAIGV
jgi:site-specific recombinase XerD